MKKKLRELNRSFWNLINYNGYCFIAWIMMWFVIIVTLVSFPICSMEYNTHRVEHEQLRADWQIARMSRHHREVEMVMGQITTSNAKIMECRWWNTLPYFQIIVPNGWDTLELIDIDPLATRIEEHK